MTILSVKGQSFATRIPTDSVVGTVNAETVQFSVDDSWKGLQVFAVFANTAIPEQAPVPVLLDETMTCAIPRHVLAKPGKILVGLLGKNGVDTVKPTMWLEYSNASEQVPPDGGIAPDDEHTKDVLDQMVALQQQSAADVKAAKEAAEKALEAAALAGPNAEAAKRAAEEAAKSSEAAKAHEEEAAKQAEKATSAANRIGASVQQAQQAATEAGKAQTASETAKQEALNAASTAQGAAKNSADSAKDANDAKLEAQKAAAALPAPSPEVAGMVPMVNPEGNGYIFGEAGGGGGGGAGGELLLADYVHQGNQEIHFTSFDWETGIGECTEPHGLTEATQAMLVWNDWMTGNVYANATAMPIEWTSLDQNLFLLPTDNTHVMVVGNDKSTPITVNSSDDFNVDIDATKIHFEVPVSFKISDLPELCIKVQLTILGIVMGNKRYRYTTFICKMEDGRDLWVSTLNLLYPPYFGAITKPRHGIFTSHNITIDLNDVCGASVLYSNYLIGRRNNYVGFPGETYTEIDRTIVPYYVITKPLGVKSIQNDSAYAVWANGTRMRVYGLCKRGDGK